MTNGTSPDAVGLVEQHAAGLAETEVPVLAATRSALARLESNIDRISGNDLAQTILRDPLMTLRVIRYLTAHRTRSQTQDITTIAHALMMLGLQRFFREFRRLTTVEDQLRANPTALLAATSALSRARSASLYAREWAILRHDLDPDEVMVAALLHDTSEVLWRTVMQRERGAESSSQSALPSPPVLRHLQRELFARWSLPGLLVDLMDDRQAGRPRVLNVVLACQLANEAAFGWHGASVQDVFGRTQRLLHVSIAELHERARRSALTAARDWKTYGVRPAAYYWPMLPEKHP